VPKFFTIFISLFLLASAANAQEANVYLIKMFDCAHQPTQRSQTGFRVRGVKGLITALHGVADCQRITASSRKGLLLDQPLIIKKIDVDRDVALLSSSQIEGAPDGGLIAADNVAWESLGTVKVYGHPYGISSLETTLTLRNPPLKPLKDLVPAASLSILKERRSPNHLINILNLQGNLLPGHSGAPILDSRGHVVAVANGGLREGFAGISWAVPFEDVEWGESGDRLKTLARLDPNILFTSDTGSYEPSGEPRDDFCGQLSEVIGTAQTGFFSIVGDPWPRSQPGYFKSTIDLPGSTHSEVSPRWYVSYTMYETDSKEMVESQYYKLVTKILPCLTTWERKEQLANNYHRQYKLRLNEKGPMIQINYSSDLSGRTKNYSLYLTVYAPSETAKYLWKYHVN
jgi:hypothetical protein